MSGLSSTIWIRRSSLNVYLRLKPMVFSSSYYLKKLFTYSLRVEIDFKDDLLDLIWGIYFINNGTTAASSSPLLSSKSLFFLRKTPAFNT